MHKARFKGLRHTWRICLKASGSKLTKMLQSDWEKIWKATAQWWFSRGEMSLYLTARSVRALIWYLQKRVQNIRQVPNTNTNCTVCGTQWLAINMQRNKNRYLKCARKKKSQFSKYEMCKCFIFLKEVSYSHWGWIYLIKTQQYCAILQFKIFFSILLHFKICVCVCLNNSKLFQ